MEFLKNGKYFFLPNLGIFISHVFYLHLWWYVVFARQFKERSKLMMEIQNTKENQFAKNVKVIANSYEIQNNIHLLILLYQSDTITSKTSLVSGF